MNLLQSVTHRCKNPFSNYTQICPRIISHNSSDYWHCWYPQWRKNCCRRIYNDIHMKGSSSSHLEGRGQGWRGHSCICKWKFIVKGWQKREEVWIKMLQLQHTQPQICWLLWSWRWKKDQGLHQKSQKSQKGGKQEDLTSLANVASQSERGGNHVYIQCSLIIPLYLCQAQNPCWIM